MTYAQVADGDEATNSQYVNFDAFFLRDLDGDGYAEGIRGSCRQIGKQDTLYMDLKVQGEGYFKDGKILINSKNFYLETAIPKDVDVKENAIGSNVKEIVFNNLENGTQRLFTGVVKSGNYSYGPSKAEALENNINNYSQINSITLTGIHVLPDGTETLVEKTVEFNMDWYATVATEFINDVQEKDIKDMIDEENDEISLQFDVELKETKYEALVNKAQIEMDIPQLNGYDAIRVDVKDANYEYDNDTKKLVASKQAILDSNGKIIKNAYVLTENIRLTKFDVTVTYPLEAYKSMETDYIELQFIPKAFYEGYNNPNEEFDNPYKSNSITKVISIVFSNLDAEEGARLDVYTGKYVYNPERYIISKDNVLKIYNGISTSPTETYEVSWRTYNGYYDENAIEKTSIRNESSDVLIKNDGTEVSMENMVSNVGIYFSNCKSGLYEDTGYIKVYNDDTGELIETFTKDNWSEYTRGKPYKYAEPIEHIRIETNEIKPKSQITIHNVKELNSEYITENYSLEEFNSFKSIKSVAICDINDLPFCQTMHMANYEAVSSLAKVVMNKTSLSTQLTEENVEMKIVTETSRYDNHEKWINGAFLLKLPKEIIDLEINNVSINNSSVDIISWESYVENGYTFIKIITENDKPSSYEIVINCNLTPDPRLVSISREIELYASNENCENYSSRGKDIYDVNGNLNIEENVNRTTLALNLVSPGTLLTNQIATDYDASGSIAIAPQNAIIEKDQRKAKLELEIKNGYKDTISDISILGKIPFKGNTYAISKGNMNSEFDTEMTSEGIQVPEDLRDKAIVYYSEVEQPNKDIADDTNYWTTTPTDWSKVKSYLIVLEGYSMPVGKSHKFTYEIEIPEALNYNEVSYSHHGVYFSLDTQEGKYRTYVEPNKLGFMIAKQFNLEITKYQKDSERLVGQATYSIVEEGTEEGKARVTNRDGQIVLNNLFVDKTYIVREIKTSAQYELNPDEIRFKTIVNADGKIEPVLISGTLREGTNLIVKEGDTGYTVAFSVEDKVRPNLKVKVQELGSEINLKNIRYTLIGKGMPDSGKSVITDLNGELTITGLYIDEEYVLTETKAEGYYLSRTTFVIRNNNGVYEAIINEGKVDENRVEIVDEIPTINFLIKIEKIPTYSLDITKIAKGENTTLLAGAKFKLLKDERVLGEYISDENGKIVIPNLYQYVDGKDLDCTYMLKETFAPAGYAKVKDIVFKVQKIDGVLEFKEELSAGQTAKSYTSEGDIVHLVIEDSPSFKLVKKDGTTAEVLPGVKFAVYNVDNGDVPAKDSKGNIIGTREFINGREYYVVSTNEKGELTVDLPEGLYKAVEVEADDKYDLKDNEYYFGIGASREALKTLNVELYEHIGGTDSEYIKSISKTMDGGAVAGGFFKGTITLNNGEKVTSRGDSDVIVIKYAETGEVQWYKQIGGIGSDECYAVLGTSDGGVAVGFKRGNSVNTLEDGTVTTNNGVLLLKYDFDGNLMWHKDTRSDMPHASLTSITETVNKQIVIGIKWCYRLFLENGDRLDGKQGYDTVLIRYSEHGDFEWYYHFDITTGGGTVRSITGTNDGGIVESQSFESTITISDDIQLTSKGVDGLIIKHDSEGNVQWYKQISGEKEDIIHSVIETSDSGILVGGFFENSITLDNGDTITSKGNRDGILLKYTKDGELEWYKQTGGTGNDYIYSIVESKDGGILAGGSFTGIFNMDDGNKLSASNVDGIVLKYTKDGKQEWVKQIESTNNMNINSIIEMDNGEILVAGEEYLGNIILSDYDKIKTENWDGVILKLTWDDTPEIVPKKLMTIGGIVEDTFQTVVGTSDGGLVAGGTFRHSITLDDNIVIPAIGTTNNYGIIVKYGSDNKIEWYKQIKANYSRTDSIIETSDGGILVAGEFNGNALVLENGDKISSGGKNNGIIFKYSKDGEFEWYKQIKCDDITIYSIVETKDGGLLIGGEFKNTITLDDIETVIATGDKDGIVLKYNKNGELEYYRKSQDSAYDTIHSVTETTDGGIVAGGYFRGSITLDNGDVLTATNSYAGLILKYSKDGKLEWYKQLGDYIYSLSATKDGGVIAGGKFYPNIVLDNEETVSANGGTDGIIIKYDKNGNLEWHKEIAERANNEIYFVKEATDGGILVGGSIAVYDGANNKRIIRGLVAKYTSGGELQWKSTMGSKINSVAETTDGSIVAVGDYSENMIGLNGEVITSKGRTDGFITKMQVEMGVPEVQELEVKNYLKEFKITTNVEEINGVQGGTISGEGLTNYETIQYGGTSTKEIKIVPDEGYEIISIKINGEEYSFETLEDGSYVMPQFTNVTEDKNIVVTYALSDSKIIINNVDSQTNERITGAKFKLDQLEERQDPIDAIGELTGNSQEYTVDEVTQKYDFTVVDGIYESTNQGKDSTVSTSYIPIDLRNNLGKYNLKLKYKISSEQGKDLGWISLTENTNRITSGNMASVSGLRTDFTEISKVLDGGKMYYLHFAFSKNDSGAGGDDKLVISDIKLELNSSELKHIEIETNSDGQAITQIPFGKYQVTEIRAPEGYWLNEEITTIEFRKDGVKEFDIPNERKGKVTVHHYIKGTTTKLAEDEISEYRPNDTYTVLPKVDLEKYELEKDENGEYVIPSNSIGTYISEDIVVTYYYVKKSIPLVVKHYIEGTEESVPLADGSLAEDELYSGQEGEEYKTLVKEGIDWKYELVEEPLNKNGVYEYPGVNVVYYYKLKDYDITTEVAVHEETNILGETTLVKGGTISGEGVAFYENVVVDLNSTKDIVVQADEGYKIKSIKVQKISDDGKITEETVEVAENTNAYVLEKFNNVTTDINVIAEFERVQGTVTVHHYIEGTANRVLLQDGTEVQDEIKIGYVGDMYATKPREDALEEYVLVEEPANISGQYIEGNIDVIYYYKAMPAKVIVKYLELGTDTELAENQIIDGIVEESYNTVPITIEGYDILLDETVGNTTGNMTKDVIYVTYYYQKKPVNIIANTVEKTGTELIIKEDDKVTYNISYRAEFEDFKGTGVLTIVDQLPFEIYGETAMLDGGIYNEAEKTITWIQNLGEINTYLDGNKSLEFNKQITVVYKDMDYSKKMFTNKVTSKLLLGETEYTAQAMADTETKFTKSVEVTKVWDHTNNIYERPNVIKVQLKRGNTVIGEKDMTSIDRVTDIEIPENQDIWKTEFTDLQKYDSQGKEIDYTVNEVLSEELKYYEATYNQESKTITNTYVGPIISQEKEAITEHGRIYVVEGEKITYKIKAKNDGKVAKDIIIKDSIPNGTTFVEDSIKINGVAILNTQEELADGITVSVPANGEIILSFDVTVDELQEGIYFKQLKNKAVVDGKDTNEVVINVNKSNVIFEKTVTPSGNVTVGQELTYNVKVRNTGSLTDIVRIEDSIPANTTYVTNSVKLNNVSYLDEELTINTEGSSLLSDLENSTLENIEMVENNIEGYTSLQNVSNELTNRTVIASEKSITLTKLEEKVTKITAENIQLGENEQVILSFKVRVNDSVENGTKIENTAIVNGKSTVPVENTVIRPIISVQKEITNIEHTSEQENRLDYVFKGDTITYNIIARNTGDLGGYVTIKDVISENTTLELGSMKINGVSNYVVDGVDTDLSSKTAQDLANGIRIYVPERHGEKAGESILSFNVQVRESARGDIENKAIWLEGENLDEHETEIVKVPVIVFEKIAEIKRIADTSTDLPENTVTVNDEIEYRINIRNTGTTDSDSFVITDDVPENIELKQILSDGVLTDSKLTWSAESLQAGESKSVGFIVTVKYNKEKTANIRNIAYVNDVPTNETITQYQKPDPKLETNITKNGDETVIAGNGINYEISYTGEIKDFVGKANIVIIDQLPYEIDEAKSSLNGGIYNELLKTITWIVPIENIDTYTSGKVSKEITRNITLYYKTEAKEQTIENMVTAKTELIELLEEVVESQEKTAVHIVNIKEIQELPATGGKGIEIFMNIGLILIGMAIVILIIYKLKCICK